MTRKPFPRKTLVRKTLVRNPEPQHRHPASQQRLDSIEHTLEKMFPSEQYWPEEKRPSRFEQFVDTLWHHVCRPEVLIVLAAFLALWIGMSHIESMAEAHVP